VYSTGGETEPEAPQPAPAAPRPGKGGIRLRLERRAAGRLMTVVTGLPGTPAAAEELAKALRRAAAGASGAASSGEVAAEV
jgi:translation initiation factor 1 (eIF-1/SUI1)